MTAILAFGPAIAWLGNPSWWRETFPRLAHYYQISSARRGVLPDIQTVYFGQIYEFSLPWHSGFVLIGITVPAAILAASLFGILYASRQLARRDLLPLFFTLMAVTPPALRLLPTPAHDGVRLFLPTFAFLAALAGWGASWLAEGLARWLHFLRPAPLKTLVAATVILCAALQLVSIHPYELSYYNELIGGPRGAWRAGFELAYWYDAFTPRTLSELNKRLPPDALISYANERSNPVMIPIDLQAAGELRADLVPWDPSVTKQFPFMWLLTHDSKATAFTRLLFVTRPWFAVEPRQLDYLRVVTVADPVAVSRAWAIQLLCDGSAPPQPPPLPLAPAWVYRFWSPLARLWGDGLTQIAPLGLNAEVFQWAQDDPEGLRQAAAWIAAGRDAQQHPGARRLAGWLVRYDAPERGVVFSKVLLRARPEAVLDAAKILIARGDAVERALLHQTYIDPDSLGGFIDQELFDREAEMY